MKIQMKSVYKSFDPQGAPPWVLEQIDLDLPGGEQVAILGPSGSGKSTLLHLIGALEPVTRGSLMVGELFLEQLKPRQLERYRRDNLGFLFQFYNLVSHLNIRENVEVCANLVRDPLDVDALLDQVGLYEHRYKLPAQLSGGQQQRCALARAVVKKPKLLLCDEPTGALDSHSAREVLALIEKLHTCYQTDVLMVTHNREIAKMCDRVLEIRDGHLTQETVNAHPVSVETLDL